MGTRCADHVTPLYAQKLALTSPTGDGRSVGIVRSRTKATEFSLVLCVRKKRLLRLFVHTTTREPLSGYSRNLHLGIIQITVEPLVIYINRY